MDVVKWSGAVQSFMLKKKKYALTQYQFAVLTVLWGAKATRRRPQDTMFGDSSSVDSAGSRTDVVCLPT